MKSGLKVCMISTSFQGRMSTTVLVGSEVPAFAWGCVVPGLWEPRPHDVKLSVCGSHHHLAFSRCRPSTLRWQMVVGEGTSSLLPAARSRLWNCEKMIQRNWAAAHIPVRRPRTCREHAMGLYVEFPDSLLPRGNSLPDTRRTRTCARRGSERPQDGTSLGRQLGGLEHPFGEPLTSEDFLHALSAPSRICVVPW